MISAVPAGCSSGSFIWWSGGPHHSGGSGAAAADTYNVGRDTQPNPSRLDVGEQPGTGACCALLVSSTRRTSFQLRSPARGTAGRMLLESHDWLQLC
jgi:hypothetical protein